VKGVADILLSLVSKYLLSSRQMTLAAAFRSNSGADRYPDLGRALLRHTSLVDGRFGRMPPKERWWLDFVSDNRSMGPPPHTWALRVSARARATGRNQKLDKIATTGHDALKSRPAMPQAMAGIAIRTANSAGNGGVSVSVVPISWSVLHQRICAGARARRRPVRRRSVVIQQPFLAGGFSAFSNSHLLPKALKVEVLPGECSEGWGRFCLSLMFRSLKGSIDLLAHLKPLLTD